MEKEEKLLGKIGEEITELLKKASIKAYKEEDRVIRFTLSLSCMDDNESVCTESRHNFVDDKSCYITLLKILANLDLDLNDDEKE